MCKACRFWHSIKEFGAHCPLHFLAITDLPSLTRWVMLSAGGVGFTERQHPANTARLAVSTMLTFVGNAGIASGTSDTARRPT